MNRGFWDKLSARREGGPIMVLAPMANVTDGAFRHIIAKYGKPDVMWTEFVSVDGLISEGREKILPDLMYGEEQRPIVAQIFGANPENYVKVAAMLRGLGFDGIDINMGCPDRGVEKQCAGAAMIKDPVLALEVIAATKEGAGDLPVSVKTRLGFSKMEYETWIPTLMKGKPAALIVHLRTRKEMSKVPAHWELMPEVVNLVRQEIDPDERPLVLGNGDVLTLEDAEEKCRTTGADGVMIGRGIFGNPWMFNRQIDPLKISIGERMSAMMEHTFLFEQMFTGIKNFEVMKKHYKAYVNHFDGAKELRMKLMEAENAQEVYEIVVQHFPVVANKKTL